MCAFPEEAKLVVLRTGARENYFHAFSRGDVVICDSCHARPEGHASVICKSPKDGLIQYVPSYMLSLPDFPAGRKALAERNKR